MVGADAQTISDHRPESPHQSDVWTDESKGKQTERLAGLDVARSIAIFGMTFVHFCYELSPVEKPRWIVWIIERMDGRAAAIFFVLSGIGIHLMTNRTSSPDWLSRARLAKRGQFLLLVGLLNLVPWEWDILRIYGVSMLLIAWALPWLAGREIRLALASFAAFYVLYVLIDYRANWSKDELQYTNLFEVDGFIRHLWYDGSRSVIPWISLLLIGIWLGRNILPKRHLWAPIAAVSWIFVLSLEWLSATLTGDHNPAADFHNRTAWNLAFGLDSMPPMPLFWCASIGVSLAVIFTCLTICRVSFVAWMLTPLAMAGQLALTLYIGHIWVGIGAIEILKLNQKFTLEQGCCIAMVIFFVSVGLATLWRFWFESGPLERLMRFASQ